MNPDGRSAYVTDDGDASVAQFDIGADGVLSPKTPSTVAAGAIGCGVAVLPDQGPTASFKSTPAEPGKAAKFNATVSTDSDGQVVRYDWDFGDGTTVPNGGPTPTHRYAKAGLYGVTLTVTDDAGCSRNLTWNSYYPFCNGNPAARTAGKLDTLPSISGLSATNKRFAAASARHEKVKRGTAFTYKLSEAAKVIFTIERKTTGRKVRNTCKRKTRKNAKKRRCALFKKVGSFAVAGLAGANKTKFSGKIRGKKLKRGPYRATAVAADSAGGKSSPKSISFAVIQR